VLDTQLLCGTGLPLTVATNTQYVKKQFIFPCCRKRFENETDAMVWIIENELAKEI